MFTWLAGIMGCLFSTILDRLMEVVLREVLFSPRLLYTPLLNFMLPGLRLKYYFLTRAVQER